MTDAEKGDNRATTYVLIINRLHQCRRQQGDNSRQTAFWQGDNKVTTTVLTANDLRQNGIRKRVRRDTQVSTQVSTPNTLGDNDLRQNGIRKRVREGSTIDSSIYSNEYILIKDKSLINPLCYAGIRMKRIFGFEIYGHQRLGGMHERAVSRARAGENAQPRRINCTHEKAVSQACKGTSSAIKLTKGTR